MELDQSASADLTQGPLTEELVFRSTILSVSILGGLSTRSLIFGTPLWFGLAHAHHALDQWKKGGKTREAAIRAVLTSCEWRCRAVLGVASDLS